jgi:hypothetical protein
MRASDSHHARPADFRGRVEAACHITVPILNAKTRSAMAKKIGLGLQNHARNPTKVGWSKTIADRPSCCSLGDRNPGPSQFAYASSWRGTKSAAASSQQEDNQDNQQDGAQAASDIRAAIVEATTAEQDQQDDD